MVNGEQRRRLVLVAAVAVLAVLALAIAGSPGRLDAHDPGLWLAVLAALVAAAVLVWAGVQLLMAHAPARSPTASRAQPRQRPAMLPVLLALLVAAVVVTLVARMGRGRVPSQPPGIHAAPRPTAAHQAVSSTSSPNLGPLVLILAGLAVAVVLMAVAVARLRSRRQSITPPERVLLADDPLVAAVDAALLDLEGEPDPRRAVIKAYARTESVLREHGVGRHPAETPLEFLDRVLRELGGQASVVDRLTVLFELAAFSHRSVTAATRDEALSAFHALRAGLAEPAAADQ